MTLRRTRIGELTIAYREAGRGPTVLLIHGWPTSSYLWRDVIPWLAPANRVIAIDLPGFGGSTKPLDAPYDLPYHERVLDGFLDDLGVDRLALVGHDIGGPIAVSWALHRPERVLGLGILNTVLDGEVSDAAAELLRVLAAPGTRNRLVSPRGLATVMRLGVAGGTRLDEDTLAAVAAPFADDDAREALLRAANGLDPRALAEVTAGLTAITAPVRIIFGRHDPLLPDVDRAVARLTARIPHADATVLDRCGHFLQEEEPERIGRLLATFLGTLAAGPARTG
ncbi:alpha/beta fold hydrolase [Virgisporangium aurantiacum]|uniref:Haloalkane dehalogenase n=1 Tax=Virgisporangium aurantiacum TaxID=175570 RepID=A0A8J4E2P8_9ACTN|nr:alpha/beta fold hydrolase [Virgisporangium aurantiacum]GIJ60085.1 haloalkane dehalogenase [Virgisporangium aurantiacum]